MSRLDRPARAMLPAFALANAAAVLAYLPFLALLLPLKVEALVGAGRVTVLSLMLGSGAVVASVANILVGMMIDRSRARGGGRRRWIVAGLAATAGGYAAVLAAQTPLALFGAVMLFQAAVNVLIAPVILVMVEDMREGERGMAGGLMTLGQPLAMLAGTGLVMLYDRSESATYLAVCLGVGLLVLPLLAVQGAVPATAAVAMAPGPPRPPRQLIALGISRLLLLTAQAVLTGILVYYFEAVTGHLAAAVVARRVGLISMAANTVAVPMAISLSARARGAGQRRGVAISAALGAAAALTMMALGSGWVVPAIGYGLFVAAVQIYVAQHSAMVAQTLGATAHPARDLGMQNLANTVPSVLGPLLVVGLYAWSGIGVLLTAMVGLVLASGVTLALGAGE